MSNRLFHIRGRQTRIRNSLSLIRESRLLMSNCPFLIRKSATQMRNGLFLIGERALQITNSLWYCAGTRMRICDAAVRLRASPRLRHSLWAKIYEKTSRNVYFSTLLVGLVFREDFLYLFTGLRAL